MSVLWSYHMDESCNGEQHLDGAMQVKNIYNKD